jgi:hypothetical protein
VGSCAITIKTRHESARNSDRPWQASVRPHPYFDNACMLVTMNHRRTHIQRRQQQLFRVRSTGSSAKNRNGGSDGGPMLKTPKIRSNILAIRARCRARVAAARSVEDIGLSPFDGRPRRRCVEIGFLAAIVISFAAIYNLMSATTENSDDRCQDHQTRACSALNARPLRPRMQGGHSTSGNLFARSIIYFTTPDCGAGDTVRKINCYL